MIRRMISPPYLQFFISDASLPENPIQGETIQIISNGKCLSVPCASRDEADTELIVGTAVEVVETGKPQFDGMIPTASGSLVFSDAELVELLEFPAPAVETRVRIWTDGSMLPERIVVAVG